MRLFFLLLLICFSTLTWCVKANSRIPLSISVSNTWMPYVYLDEQRELDGRDYSLLKNILEELGYELVRVDSAVAEQSHFQQHFGSNDVQLGVKMSADNMHASYFSIPYRQNKIGLFYLEADLFSGDEDALVSALQSGDCMGAANHKMWFGEEFQKLQSEFADYLLDIESQVAQLRMLQKGRVKFVIGDALSVKALANKLKIRDLIQHPYPVHVEDIHFVFSKDKVDMAFMNRFNAALQTRLAY